MWLSLARAPDLGSGGREFESRYSDQWLKLMQKTVKFILFDTAISGCSSVWLERLIWDQEVAGSNPVIPTMECSSAG